MSVITDRDVDTAARSLSAIFAANSWTWGNATATPTQEAMATHITNLLYTARYERHSGTRQGHDRVSSGRITILRHNVGDPPHYMEEIRLETSALFGSGEAPADEQLAD